MLATETVLPKDDRHLVLFALCQLVLVTVVLAGALLIAPTYAIPVSSGAIIVVVANAIIASLMLRAQPGALVMYAMLRSVVVSVAVVIAYLLFMPDALAYFIGVGIGLVVITVVPVALSFRRSFGMRPNTFSKG